MKSCSLPLRALALCAALLGTLPNLARAAETAAAAPAGPVQPIADILELPLSGPSRWVIDTTHLGTRQVDITYDASEKVAVVRPTWSEGDANSKDVGVRNIENSCLYLFQMVKRSDATQSESVLDRKSVV